MARAKGFIKVAALATISAIGWFALWYGIAFQAGLSTLFLDAFGIDRPGIAWWFLWVAIAFVLFIAPVIAIPDVKMTDVANARIPSGVKQALIVGVIYNILGALSMWHSTGMALSDAAGSALFFASAWAVLLGSMTLVVSVIMAGINALDRWVGLTDTQ